MGKSNWKQTHIHIAKKYTKQQREKNTDIKQKFK